MSFEQLHHRLERILAAQLVTEGAGWGLHGRVEDLSEAGGERARVEASKRQGLSDPEAPATHAPEWLVGENEQINVGRPARRLA